MDRRPEFEIVEFEGRVNATVTLPVSVPANLRYARSRYSWETERTAKKDAAFEAYIALYKAGQVNDNLLPLFRSQSKLFTEDIEKRPSLVDVSWSVNPWVDIAKTWMNSNSINETVLYLHTEGRSPVQVNMLLPVKPPPMPSFELYWNQHLHFTLRAGSTSVHPQYETSKEYLAEATYNLLHSVVPNRVRPDKRDFIAFFKLRDEEIVSDIRPSLSFQTRSALDVFAQDLDKGLEYGIVRHQQNNGIPYTFKSWRMGEVLRSRVALGTDDPELEEVLHIEATRFPKRADFLHRLSKGNQIAQRYTTTSYLRADECIIDDLPFRYAQLAVFIPSILHRYEVLLIAELLSQTILAPARFENLSLVLTSICASSAREQTNYQRLEFLGDSVLKMCTSVHVLSEHPDWHEGYLSACKDRAVANSRLARAAIETGLDRFILTRAFTGYKWKPMYCSKLMQEPTKNVRRQMSTKVLADVVEAIIGAAFVEGGSDKALVCMGIFLPEHDWLPLASRNAKLYETLPAQVILPAHFRQLEILLGHVFTNKALLVEAMTHPSYSASTSVVPYQRLEFLGDSVLDYIVVSAIFKEEREIKHQDMHLMRTALVNADFLAFLCMELKMEQSSTEILEDKTAGTFYEHSKTTTRSLWQFMRHTSSNLCKAQQKCHARFETLKESIRDILDHGNVYPWTKLAQLSAEKFFSDLVESSLGAIYVDTQGDIPTCERFLDKIGVLGYLRRVITGEVHLMHPKQQLGQIAVTDTVEYVTSRDNQSEHEGSSDVEAVAKTGRGRFGCQVKVAGEEIVRIADGLSRMEVETRAAEEAVKIVLARST